MRHVYFSFHFKRDIMRVNQVRKSGLVFGARSIGFADRSLWEKAKTTGKAALERLIDKGLEGTSVTVVLIGSQTANRNWVRHEIEKSIERGNALLGLRIHHLKAPRIGTDLPGPVPEALRRIGAPVYRWNHDAAELGEWVEDAFQNQSAPEERGTGKALLWTAVGAAGAFGLAAWLKNRRNSGT